MAKMTMTMTGMEQTLRFWKQGNKPLKIEGRVGSDLEYALKMHESLYIAGVMLRKDLEKIRKGINPTTDAALKWGKKRVAKAIKGIEAKLALLATPQPEGIPGRKYLTNVIEYHAKMYVDAADDILPHAVALMVKNEGIRFADAYAAVADLFLKKVTLHIWGRSKHLAPLWHGDLRRSLTAYIEGRQYAGGGMATTQVDKKEGLGLEKAPNVKRLMKGGAKLLASLDKL